MNRLSFHDAWLRTGFPVHGLVVRIGKLIVNQQELRTRTLVWDIIMMGFHVGFCEVNSDYFDISNRTLGKTYRDLLKLLQFQPPCRRYNLIFIHYYSYICFNHCITHRIHVCYIWSHLPSIYPQC
jgi:hypothetical protein